MMAPRRFNSKKQKHCVMISTIIFMMGLVGFSHTVFPDQSLLIVSADEAAEPWNITIHIKETSGMSGNMIIIGTAINASDGLDQYDLPEPPFPPQFPYLRSWLETTFSPPFNNLLQEYKSSPSRYSSWNLSVLWMPIPENKSKTIIEISWDSVEINIAHLDLLSLYQNNTLVADLRTTDSYSFPSNDSIHYFQIIGQSISKNNTSEQNTLPILQIILGGIVLVIVAIIAFFWYKRKK